MVVRARRSEVVTGLSTLVGQLAHVEQVRHGAVLVRLQGELWQVNCDRPLAVGDAIRVEAAEGVILDVKKVEGQAL